MRCWILLPLAIGCAGDTTTDSDTDDDGVLDGADSKPQNRLVT